MAVQWGQRKALGRRYSVDPAITMEQQRLQQEYGLIPGREARALQESQFTRSLQEQTEAREDASKQAMYSGMMGTAGNVALGGGMIYAMGRPWGTAAQTVPNLPVGGATAPTGIGGGGLGSGQIFSPFTVTPGGDLSGGLAPGVAPAGGVAPTAAPAAGVGAGAVTIPAAAAFTAGTLSPRVHEIGRIATLGMVGNERTRDIAGGVLAGAATGGVMGGPVGAVIGGIVGGVGGAVGGDK